MYVDKGKDQPQTLVSTATRFPTPTTSLTQPTHPPPPDRDNDGRTGFSVARSAAAPAAPAMCTDRFPSEG